MAVVGGGSSLNHRAAVVVDCGFGWCNHRGRVASVGVSHRGDVISMGSMADMVLMVEMGSSSVLVDGGHCPRGSMVGQAWGEDPVVEAMAFQQVSRHNSQEGREAERHLEYSMSGFGFAETIYYYLHTS